MNVFLQYKIWLHSQLLLHFIFYFILFSLKSNSLPSIPIQTNTKNTISYKPVLEQIRTFETNIQQVLSLIEQLLRNQTTVDIGTYPLEKMFRKDSFDSQLAASEKRLSFQPLPQLEPMTVPSKYYSLCSCCTNNNHKQSNIKRLPSLRYAVDNMITSLVQLLYANNRFMRTQEKSHQSIGDLLSFHTLPYAFKNMVETTTDLAKSARRIKHIDTRTLTRSEREEQQQQTV